jgi:methanogenic corrinoid protein MtbC1
MTDGTSGEPRYPVRVVMARTGLTADVLRAWERRYGAVRPERSPGGQRLYSEHDVERLTLLRRATLAGHSIAEVARLDTAALETLFEEPEPAPTGASPEAVDALVAIAIAATERLDGPAVEAALKRGALLFGGAGLVDEVVSRFMTRVGERWHSGTLSPAHEHLASTAVRRVLAWAIDAYTPTTRAPRLVVATPAGELHEIGAMAAAAAAAEEGWRVVYLGPNLPAVHLVDAAKQVGARAVALSAVYADGDPHLHEVHETARALPRGVTLLVGGEDAEAQAAALREAGAQVLPDIPALRRALRAVRSATQAEAGEGKRGA